MLSPVVTCPYEYGGQLGGARRNLTVLPAERGVEHLPAYNGDVGVYCGMRAIEHGQPVGPDTSSKPAPYLNVAAHFVFRPADDAQTSQIKKIEEGR